MGEMGYSKLRANQEKVVKTFLRCRDVFVSLPTGSGKSLCYCILPVVFDKLRRWRGTDSRSIASPLKELMKDQVMAMTLRDVSAIYTGEVEEGSNTFLRICGGKYQIVYLPHLSSPPFSALLAFQRTLGMDGRGSHCGPLLSPQMRVPVH